MGLPEARPNASRVTLQWLGSDDGGEVEQGLKESFQRISGKRDRPGARTDRGVGTLGDAASIAVFNVGSTTPYAPLAASRSRTAVGARPTPTHSLQPGLTLVMAGHR